MDSLKVTQEQIHNYFWVIDGHHNSKGYAMMAQCIFENISPLLKDALVVAVQ